MTKPAANEEAMRAVRLDVDTFGTGAVMIGDDGVWQHVPLHEIYEPAKAEEELRRHGEGLPDVTELGEPVAGAMFSDRYVDVEHMPREVQSEPWYAEQRRFTDGMHREHMARAAGIPPDWVWKIVAALVLIALAIPFAAALLG